MVEAVASAAPGEGERLRATGVLVQPEASGVKSREAYLAAPFYLEQGHQRWPLAVGAVGQGALEALVGQAVEVEATWRGPRPPEPWESAPLGPEGQPEARPGLWLVDAVRRVAGG